MAFLLVGAPDSYRDEPTTINKKPPEGGLEVAGSIEISNQLISDMLEFVEVAEELINAEIIHKSEIPVS